MNRNILFSYLLSGGQAVPALAVQYEDGDYAFYEDGDYVTYEG